MKYIGIDPGFEGALAVITDEVGRSGFSVEIFDTPVLVVKGKKEKREFSVPEMWRILHKAIEGADNVIIGIEEVGPRPMEGVVSVFRFGMGYGLWLGLITALGLRHEKIAPLRWKRDIFGNKGMEKDASVAKAEQLFPLEVFRTERGRLLDGRAEALLIADYVRRQWVQGKL